MPINISIYKKKNPLFLILLLLCLLSAHRLDAASPVIRVLIFQGEIKRLHKVSPAIRIGKDRVLIRGKSRTWDGGVARFEISPYVTISGRRYKGSLFFYRKGNRVEVINALDLEEYLGGVLAAEISYSWHPEAIKAQAVAARTYACHHWAKVRNKRFHVEATTTHQVFFGSYDVHEKFKKAISQTRGEMLTYRKKLVPVYFTATCGGKTEKPEYVWPSFPGQSLKYLRHVRCSYCVSHPRFRWKARFSTDAIQKRLAKAGFNVGDLRYLRIHRHSPSRRVKEIKITGKKKTIICPGNRFRLAVGPTQIQSLRFKLKKRGRNYSFEGTGYGHGVGLCQWGAKVMAERGYSYRAILKFYYRGIRIRSLKK